MGKISIYLHCIASNFSNHFIGQLESNYTDVWIHVLFDGAI